MITVFIASVAGSIVISALCSLMEAALYAAPIAYAKHSAESGSAAGRALLDLKANMRDPIAAILILNTISNTAGASVAGWACGQVFGSQSLAVFSALFTLAILYLSEILPKTIGVTYAKKVSLMVAIPLKWIVRIFAPLIWFSKQISGFITKEDEPSISHEELLSMAAIGTEEGALDHFEGSVISNVIGLDKLLVADVLTPRVVVFRLEEDTKIGDMAGEIAEWNFSRVPLFKEKEPDHLTSYVTQRDIYRELLQSNTEKTVKEIARPLPTIPELMRTDLLLLKMFEEKEHICAVVDEHGGLAGIITLEDIIEEVVGREIVDEYDSVSDLRTFAKILRVTKSRKKNKEEKK